MWRASPSQGLPADVVARGVCRLRKSPCISPHHQSGTDNGWSSASARVRHRAGHVQAGGHHARVCRSRLPAVGQGPLAFLPWDRRSPYGAALRTECEIGLLVVVCPGPGESGQAGRAASPRGPHGGGPWRRGGGGATAAKPYIFSGLLPGWWRWSRDCRTCWGPLPGHSRSPWKVFACFPSSKTPFTLPLLFLLPGTTHPTIPKRWGPLGHFSSPAWVRKPPEDPHSGCLC